MASNRIVDKASGLNLQTFQRNASSPGLNHQVLTIPSDTQAAFSGYFTISLRETNIFVHQLLLQVTANAIVGMTGNPRYVPANFFFSRIEIFSAGNVIQTIYPAETHVLNNLFFDDADRLSINKTAGHYANVADRVAKSAATTTYYVNLRSIVDQIHFPILTANHQLQLRVYTDTLSNCTVSTSGTPTNTGITSCSLIARISRIDQQVAAGLLADQTRVPYDSIFHQTRLFSSTVTCASTGSSSRLILSPIVGSVPFFYFTVRNTSALTQENYFTYQPITSFAILSGAGQNEVGGSQLSAALVQDTLMKEWTLSSFCAENNANLVASYQSPFAGSNVYMYSHSPDPITAYKTGSALGSRKYNGSEILEIYFAATGTYQIDMYVSTENVLTQTPAGISISSV